MDQIGRYRITGELGRGAMGVVYRALDPAIGRTVAIKTIRIGELVDADERAKLRDRLFREAQSAGILSHPNIVTIYDIGEEGEFAYVAMECVDGPTLNRMVGEDPPDGRLILSILSQTAAALDYAHKRGIVHRDIKPANMIVHERKHAKITDFGVAKIQSHQMTQAGSMIGTPNYMSPEQIQGKAVDGRSDQYSLAVIAYELLTGEKPFSGDSIASLAFRIVNEKPAPVHRLNPTLGWTVDTVIQKGLAKNPEERYPTCSDLVFALENACRACKEWRPMAGGGASDAATLVESKAPMAAPAAAAAAPAFAERAPAARPVPRPLRWARMLALVVLGASAMSLVFVFALRMLSERREVTAQSLEPQPAASADPRPSAMGEPVIPALPADRGAEQPAPESEPAAPEPAQPEPPKPEPPKAMPPRPSVQAAETRLVTNPPGAFLVVDGRSDQSCMSPCTLKLTPGRHTLAATKEGYRRTLKILNVPEDSENFLNLERTSGTVVVKSEPQGAAIFVNGQRRSERTPAMLTLPTGRYAIEVEHSGRRERHDVEVRDSVITNVAVSFPER